VAKSPNKTPNKGFVNELAKTKQASHSKTKLDWAKPIAGTNPVQNLSTTHRLEKFKAAQSPDSNMADELATHIQQRRAKL
jgi:hypothetical protein